MKNKKIQSICGGISSSLNDLLTFTALGK